MKKEIIDKILERELKKSMGCTEPSAIAYAISFAKEYFKSIDDVETIDVYLSPNMLKNALSVTIPNTNLCGIETIVLLSMLYGESKNKLEIFKNINTDDIKNISRECNRFKINVHHVDVNNTMYIEVSLNGKGKNVTAVMIEDHDSIKRLCIDGEVIIDTSVNEVESGIDDSLSFNDIYEYVMNDQYDLGIVKDIILCDKEIIEYGMNNDVGLNIGKGLKDSNIYSDGINDVIAKTISAVDSRMCGAAKSVYINNGSGNQGITATAPIIEMAKYLKVSDEKMYRAIMLSYLTAVYIKARQNRLSSTCGAVVASSGASAGIAYMLNCNEEEIKRAVLMTLCSSFGAFCDGAKESCSFKVMSGLSSAINSAYLSKRGIFINKNMGIISTDFDETLDNIARVEKEFTKNMDNCIMDTSIQNVLVKRRGDKDEI